MYATQGAKLYLIVKSGIIVAMTRPKLNKPLHVSVKQNWLTVNRRTLCAEALGDKPKRTTVNANQLRQVLHIGRGAILEGIEVFYDKMRAANPSVDRPSFFALQLGDIGQTDGRQSSVFTEKGYNNGGIIQAVDELKPDIRPYWSAAMDVGFKPEVRRTSGKQDGGSWLLLRKPTLAQVSSDWLGVHFTLPDVTAETHQLTPLQKVAVVDEYRQYLHAQIDEHDDVLKAQSVNPIERTLDRSRLQISSLVGVLAYKQALGYGDGDLNNNNDIEDVLRYAGQFSPPTLCAIENALY